MKYTQKRDKNTLTVSFKMTAEEWATFDKRAYEQNKGKYNVPGFRKGHVPRNVIESRYGKVFFEEAVYLAAQEYYSEFLDKNKKVDPVSRPTLDEKSVAVNEKGASFDVVVTVRPEVTLGQYKGLTIEKVAPQKVKTADVDAEIAQVRERNARFVEVTDRPVAEGDQVNLDYCGKVDGVAFEGGTATKQTLTIGSHTFIEGFEEQLVGMNIGETRDINVTFPTEYHAEELKGKPAVFTVTINGITVKELPELDDEFAKDVSEFDTLKEYKADIKKHIQERYDAQAARETESKLIDTVVNNTPIEIPDVMIEEQMDRYVEDFEHQLGHQGLSLDMYLKYTGSTVQQLRENYRERAQKSVHTNLVFGAIVEAEKIKASAKAVDAKIKEYAEKNHIPHEELLAQLQPGDRLYFEDQVIMEQLLDLLKKENTIA